MATDYVELGLTSGGPKVATDNDGTGEWQYAKMAFGADGTQSIVTSTTVNPLPVALSGTDNAILVTIDGVLDQINAKLVAGTVIGDVNAACTLDAETTKVIGTVRMASDGVASGSFASGSIAAGAIVDLPLPAGAATQATLATIDTDTGNMATDLAAIEVLETTIASPVDTISATPLQRVAIFDDSDAQITTFGGGTQYTEDGEADANPSGNVQILVAESTPAQEVVEDDYVARRGTRYGAAYAQIVDSSGNFIDSFGGAGGTSLADDGDFVAGTTLGTIAQGVYESSPTSVNDGDVGAVGITSTRELKVDITSNSAGVGGGTAYTQDAAITDPAAAPTVMMARTDAPTEQETATGDWTVPRTNLNGSQWIAIDDTEADVKVTLDSETVVLGAGTAEIGKLAAGTAEIGNVKNAGAFVTQIDGTALTRLTDIETNTDFGTVKGTGTEAGALRVTLATDSTGQVTVDGEVTANLGTIAGVATDAKLDTIIAAQLPDSHNVTVDNASIAVTGPATDTELRATPLPVNGTVTANLGTIAGVATDAKLDTIIAAQLPDSHNVTVDNASIAVTGPATDTELRATPLPVSGTVTETNSGTISGNIGTIAGAIKTEGSALGDAILIAGDDGTDTKHVAVDATSGNLQVDVINNVMPGVAASGGTTHWNSLSVINSTLQVVKASAGQVYWLHCINQAASVRYLKLYDATSGTIGTGTPDLVFPIPTQGDTNGAGFLLSIPNGIEFTTGISLGASTGIADNDTGAPSANDIVLNLGFK